MTLGRITALLAGLAIAGPAAAQRAGQLVGWWQLRTPQGVVAEANVTGQIIFSEDALMAADPDGQSAYRRAGYEAYHGTDTVAHAIARNLIV